MLGTSEAENIHIRGAIVYNVTNPRPLSSHTREEYSLGSTHASILPSRVLNDSDLGSLDPCGQYHTSIKVTTVEKLSWDLPVSPAHSV